MRRIPLVQHGYTQLDTLRSECDQTAAQLRVLEGDVKGTAVRLRRQANGWAASRKVFQVGHDVLVAVDGSRVDIDHRLL